MLHYIMRQNLIPTLQSLSGTYELSRQDSNLNELSQSQSCYRYITGQYPIPTLWSLSGTNALFQQDSNLQLPS